MLSDAKRIKLLGARNALLAIILYLVANTTANAQSFKFDLGDGNVADGYVGVSSTTSFSESRGYGLDGGKVSSVKRNGGNALTSDFLTTTDELFFSVVVPQGNYKVTVYFGDLESGSSTTIKAENRRLLFDRVTTATGTTVKKSVTVRRMETKSIDGSVTMSIKDREKDYYTWDNKLTLRISGSKPAVSAIEISRKDDAVTMWLCGNSTVVDQFSAPWSTWGMNITNFMDTSIAIANYAESGLTSGGFLSMKRLSKILAEAKPGDYVFVEFGHNDQKNSTDVTNYPANLKAYRDQIKAVGAIPVFVIPTARQGDNDPRSSIGGLAQKMRETADNLGVRYVDLNQMVIDINAALGNDAKLLYMYTANDKTHFCEYGGYELARAVLRGLQDKFPELVSRFRPDYVRFNPSKPDPTNVLETDLPPIAVPKAVPMCGTDTCAVVLQGENFCKADGVKERTNSGYEGDGYLNLDNALDTKASYMVYSNSAISQKFYVGYSNGGSAARNMNLTSNDNSIGDVSFPITGSWTEWGITSFDLEVSAGGSIIEFSSLSADGGPNVDWIGWLNTGVRISDNCELPVGIGVLQGNPLSARHLWGKFNRSELFLKGLPNKPYTLNIRNAQGSLVKSFQGDTPTMVASLEVAQGIYYIELIQNNVLVGRLKLAKEYK